MHQNKKHTPVLLEAVLKYLDPKAGESYLDLTAGYGGHAAAILAKTKNAPAAALIDRDEAAINQLRQQFKQAEVIHDDYLRAAKKLRDAGRQFDLILADLGVASPHLNNPERGFSLQQSGPLDMRFDRRQELTAAKLVNQAREEQLTDILRRYGEEPKAARLAKSIIAARPISDTTQLASVIAKAWPGHSRVHPATRTFQAFRIAVNNELELLESALPLWIELLAPGGRLVIISFHSLEDRLVKQAFQDVAGQRYDASLRLLTTRPVTASSDELVFNPRARSAKLRAAVKIKREGEANAYSGKKLLSRLSGKG